MLGHMEELELGANHDEDGKVVLILIPTLESAVSPEDTRITARLTSLLC